jgi:cadmium resistance protein CadD (predicted permease)
VVVADFISLIGIGAAAFVASNIGDMVVLMLFFSSSNFHARNIVIGQYLGIGSLVAISAVGSLIALVVPSYLIGLMGLAPIAIGIKKLIKKRNNKLEQEKEEISRKELMQQSNKRGYQYHYLSFLTVASVTISNGGDNIVIYTPLFASYNTSSEVTVLISVFMALTAVWCAIGYYLVRHPLLERRMLRYGHIALPFVLIGVGLYILVESFLSSFVIL